MIYLSHTNGVRKIETITKIYREETSILWLLNIKNINLTGQQIESLVKLDMLCAMWHIDQVKIYSQVQD